MNQVALVGNITDDPELRCTQSGAALAGFTVAVSHRSKSTGEWQDVTDGFFRCTASRSVTENAAKSLRKASVSWSSASWCRDPSRPKVRSARSLRSRSRM